MSESKNSLDEGRNTVIAVEVVPESKRKRGKPEPRYHVILWNDDVHSPEYVIELLIKLFSHSEEQAVKITNQVHHEGKGIALTCHKELAELKCEQVLSYKPEWDKNKSLGTLNATIEPAPE